MRTIDSPRPFKSEAHNTRTTEAAASVNVRGGSSRRCHAWVAIRFRREHPADSWLHSTTASIAQVAELSGYRTMANFNR